MKLSKLVERYKGDMLSTARVASAALSTKVIARTPVDTGRLRKSWTPARNRFDTSNSGGDVAAVASSLNTGDIFTLINAQPYARRIEYGHSGQAPGGMLRVSVAEWQGIVDAAARRGS